MCNARNATIAFDIGFVARLRYYVMLNAGQIEPLFIKDYFECHAAVKLLDPGKLTLEISSAGRLVQPTQSKH